MDAATPAYQEDWFAEIAERGQWKRSVEIWRGGRVVAYLPYIVWRKFFFHCNIPPYWVRINGPIVNEALSEDQRAEVLKELAARLPRWVSFRIVCDPLQDNSALVAAFKAAGFEHTTEKTYQENPDDPDMMDPNNRAGLDKKGRNHLRRAERKLVVTEHVSADEFINFYNTNLQAAGMTSHSPLVLARDIVAKGQTLSLPRPVDPELIGPIKPARRVVVFAAKDKSGALVAAIACLFDQKRCYYWMTTRRRVEDHGDAIKVLMMRARTRAQYLGLTFDSDGVSTPGTEKLYDLLKIPRVVMRDIFTRHAPIYGLLQRRKKEIKTLARPIQTLPINGSGYAFRQVKGALRYFLRQVNSAVAE